MRQARRAEELIASYPFIRYSRQTWVGESIEAFLKRRRLKVQETMTLDTLEAITTMVHSGLGVSIVPLRAGDDPMSLQVRQTSLSVSIWRGGQTGTFENYSVPCRDNQTVLDVVTYVQRHIDPTLSYRFACRVGMCGSCAMTVNGRPRWTCRTHASKVNHGGTLEIAPLSNLPVIKDLATDMKPFFEKWQTAEGVFEPSKTRSDAIERIKPDSKARTLADAAIECINCGVCYAACDTVRWNDDYLGPAALNRAWTLVNDRRDAGQIPRLQPAPAGGGCPPCQFQQTRTVFSPPTLHPPAARP